MAVQNNLAKQNSKPKFSMVMQSDAVKQMVNNTLGDKKKVERFTTAIISAVSTNPALQECDSYTILSGAMLGESLGLSPSPQLGHYYLVPFKNNKVGKTDAQFQLGYKGYIQLAIRSGQYKKINVLAIKEGELVNYDPLTEDLEVNLITDELQREKAKTIGYYAMFELVNGFIKTMYWSKEKMESHAMKYSKGYQAKKGYTFWEKDFDGMAFKTMLRQLISKWGIMSIEMLGAFENDYGVKDESGNVTYVDNDIEYEEVPVVSEKVESEVVEKNKPTKITKQEEQPLTTDLDGTPTLL